MPLRPSLQRPIALAITMLMLLAVLTVGWVLLNVFTARDKSSAAGCREVSQEQIQGVSKETRKTWRWRSR
jgi:hypothetical protein